MERRKADLPPPSDLGRPIGGEANLNHTSSSSSSSSLSISPRDFISQFNAVFKRQRPLGTMWKISQASRVLVSRADSSKSSISSTSVGSGDIESKTPLTTADIGAERLLSVGFDSKKDNIPNNSSNSSDNSLLTPPSITGTVTNVQDNNMCHFESHQGEAEMLMDRKKAPLDSFSSNDVLKKDQLSDDIGGLTFQRGENQFGKQVTANHQYLNQHDLPNKELHGIGGANLIEKRDLSHNQQSMDPMTRAAPLGSSYATTISVHSGPAYQCTHAPLAGSTGIPAQMPSVESSLASEPHLSIGKVASSQVPSSNSSLSFVDKEASQSSKVEKASRKKKYDPDVFFKVNGKLYQKLGKIGSGGSSEVHKVIRSDCAIYALKKIKLKGRDYPTAYGFCQEIEYLNKLKGRSNIIQLIDCEVTDKALLQEVMNGCMTIKDGRINNDQYVYMVLEYGEIDLAHMLSQKLKEVESSNCKIDENWVRFYWQQMLEAVNTIHEERIVHSDLKPANFLLVRGSLKLIDFGIAKAILSDTTNIQRDAQVGTLNYMSPEAFMWNEQDLSGNTIKCGRPSDIWSLGCILYQMVYGKTPFAEYKTFWAKFKVITDKNHKITYDQIPNPLLIDLMRRCLAWDRNERWRIPQLLQHPFIVPPIPRYIQDNQDYIFLSEKLGLYWNDPQVSRLCSELHEVIGNLERDQERPQQCNNA